MGHFKIQCFMKKIKTPKKRINNKSKIKKSKSKKLREKKSKNKKNSAWNNMSRNKKMWDGWRKKTTKKKPIIKK